MPMTEAAGRKLAELINQLMLDDPRRARPWDVNGLLRNIERVAGHDQFAIAHAALNAAEDLDADSPGVIASPDSLHWGARTSSRVPRNPLPHEECPEHPGQYRLSCSYRPPCGDRRTTPPTSSRRERPEATTFDDVREQLHRDAEFYARRERGETPAASTEETADA